MAGQTKASAAAAALERGASVVDGERMLGAPLCTSNAP
jgi:hypothetical protein